MSRMIQQRHWDVICKMAQCNFLQWTYSNGFLQRNTYKVHVYSPYESIVQLVVENDDNEISSHEISLHSWIDESIWDMLKNGFEEWKQHVLTKN